MTDLTRLDFPDGGWATFRTTYGWGPSARVQATIIDGKGSEAFFRALIRETLTGWHVRSDTGGWVDWVPTDLSPRLDDSQMDAVDSFIGEQVLDRADTIWRRWRDSRPDPKGTPAPSPSGPPESA